MNANCKTRRQELHRKVDLTLDRERNTREAEPIGFQSAEKKGMPVE